MVKFRLSGDGIYQRCASRLHSNPDPARNHWRCFRLQAQALFSGACKEEHISAFSFDVHSSSKTDLPFARTSDRTFLGISRLRSSLCHTAETIASKTRDPCPFRVRFPALQTGDSPENLRRNIHETFHPAG